MHLAIKKSTGLIQWNLTTCFWCPPQVCEEIHFLPSWRIKPTMLINIPKRAIGTSTQSHGHEIERYRRWFGQGSCRAYQLSCGLFSDLHQRSHRTISSHLRWGPPSSQPPKRTTLRWMALGSRRSQCGGSSRDLRRWGIVGTDSEARDDGSRPQEPRSCCWSKETGPHAVVECWSCLKLLSGSTWRLVPVPGCCHAPSSLNLGALATAASASSRLHSPRLVPLALSCNMAAACTSLPEKETWIQWKTY